MIVRLSNNKKSVLVVDDDGNVFISSVYYIRGLLDGKSPWGFVMLKRLANGTSATRFKPSPVLGAEGVVPKDLWERKEVEVREEKSPVGDISEW